MCDPGVEVVGRPAKRQLADYYLSITKSKTHVTKPAHETERRADVSARISLRI